jgi:hypothetical protein
MISKSRFILIGDFFYSVRRESIHKSNYNQDMQLYKKKNKNYKN